MGGPQAHEELPPKVAGADDRPTGFFMVLREPTAHELLYGKTPFNVRWQFKNH
jgi:hypothetical protein